MRGRNGKDESSLTARGGFPLAVFYKFQENGIKEASAK
jgi:hypothetical protein